MRREYLSIPAGALPSAGTVMLDWNISARIANIHRRQGRFEPLNLAAVEVDRLRSLVAAIPEGAEILGAFGAAEPETRRTYRVADVERYNERTDIASVYLSQVPDYLLHLLDGGESGGLLIESAPDEVPFASDVLRAWFMVSYAALLKAVVLHRGQSTSRADRVDQYRFWLERELKILPGRESWIGFKLLGGKGDQVGRAKRLLKIGGKNDLREAVWGATWDLMYTRIPGMMAAPPFIGNWPLPITFVTDDAALVDVLSGSSDPFVTNNAHGVVIGGESIDLSLLHDDVQSIVRSYINRERVRVLTESRGLTESAMRRAGRLAASLELRLGAQV